MSVVSNATADRFVLNPPPALQFYLIHGLDEGLILERTRAVADHLVARGGGKARLDRLDGDAIARAPGLFLDEACAMSLFGDTRIFWIDAQSRELWAALEPLFGRLPAGSAIVVRAGNLKKGTTTRTAFETRSDAVSVECYPDTPDALRTLIDREAKAAGFAVSPEAREALLSLLGGDRQATRNELAKLKDYAAGRERIELEDVHAIVSDAAPSNLDQVVDSVLSSDRNAASAAIARFFREDGDIDRLWYSLTGRLGLLYRLRIEVDRGTPMEGALRSAGVRLPWGARQAVAEQAKRRSAADLLNEIGAVRAVSARLRAQPRIAPILAGRALLALASRSRRVER